MDAQQRIDSLPTKEIDIKILMMLNQSLYKQKLIPSSVFQTVEAKILKY